VTETQGWLQTVQGQHCFIDLYISDEMMQTTGISFSEYILNLPIKHRRLSVELKYIIGK